MLPTIHKVYCDIIYHSINIVLSSSNSQQLSGFCFVLILPIFVKVGSPKSHTLEFDDGALGCTSSTFHSSLEPSILSIFEDSSAEEVRKEILYAYSLAKTSHYLGGFIVKPVFTLVKGNHFYMKAVILLSVMFKLRFCFQLLANVKCLTDTL